MISLDIPKSVTSDDGCVLGDVKPMLVFGTKSSCDMPSFQWLSCLYGLSCHDSVIEITLAFKEKLSPHWLWLGSLCIQGTWGAFGDSRGIYIGNPQWSLVILIGTPNDSLCIRDWGRTKALGQSPMKLSSLHNSPLHHLCLGINVSHRTHKTQTSLSPLH